MKIKIFIIATLLLSTACISVGTLAQPVTASLNVASYESVQSSHITADEALHLRDFPEEYGGKVVTIMPNGATFIVRSCLTTTSGTVWAYGEYVTPEGSMYGWAAARYISGGCDG